MRALAFKAGVNTRKQRQAKLWQRVTALLTAFVVMGSGIAQMALAAPGDYVWQKAPTSLKGDQMSWSSIASSSDGSKLAAVTFGGSIYTSIDSGMTWTERATAGSRSWYSIASSSDGTKLAAAVVNGSIYTSADSGATWTEQTAAGSRYWRSIASSSDGSKLAAGVYNGYLYTSTDSGATWTERTTAGSAAWTSVSSSADGSKLAAAGTNTSYPYLYTSTDYGATWTQRTAAGSRNWSHIASSSDGSKLVAGEGGGYIYTSTDSGATWTERTAAGSRNWYPVASSSNGSKLVVAANDGSLYTSTDSGATWTERVGTGLLGWSSIASSSDGSKLAAVMNNGSIYTSTDSGVNWMEHTITGDRHWYSIKTSSDGSKLAVAIVNGPIYTSTDSGATWMERTAAGKRGWSVLASSADGTKLAAGVWYGSIYTSNDSGATWMERAGAGSRSWSSIASSSDGSKLVAVDRSRDEGAVYTSVDYGATWNVSTTAGLRNWGSVVSSADGTKLLAGVDGGSLYLSNDSGATWSPVTSLNSAGGWYSLAMTPDGATLFAADAYGSDGNGGTNYDGGYAYISKDGGITWQEQTGLGLRYWNDWASDTGAISADGQTIAIADYYGSDWNDWNGGYIYVTHDSGAHWQAQTALGGKEWTSVAMNSDGSKLAAAVDGGSIYLANYEGPATATQAMAALPAGSKDATAAQPVAQASLAATSMSCYTLKPGTVSTLGPDSLVVPESDITLLGGVAFSLDCTGTGGTADTAITLGTTYTDVSALRVYKRSGTGPLVDITKQVTIQNESGKTVIRYTLTDGGAWDEDGTANSTIVDPIYIGVVNGAATTTPGAAGGSLANTGFNVYALIALAAALLTSAAAIWRKGVKAPKRVSFR